MSDWLVPALVMSAIGALLGWYVAAQKNRSVVEGVVMGGLLGPFGVIVVALLPTLPRGERDDEHTKPVQKTHWRI